MFEFLFALLIDGREVKGRRLDLSPHFLHFMAITRYYEDRLLSIDGRLDVYPRLLTQ
jgi:hypothetical protein